MTRLLYMDDSYLKEWDTNILETEGSSVVLEETAFYPRGGGQPSDTGTITANGIDYRVLEVKKEDGKIRHKLDKGGASGIAHCRIDWDHRYKIMRMHTASHLIATILNQKTGALITGNQLGEEKSRIDFSTEEYSPELMQEVIKSANALIKEGTPVKWYYLSREEAMKIPGIVKLADKLPPSIQTLRIVEIEGIDKQADGGTHVRNISEIGSIELIKTENKGKNNRRMYFRLNP